MNTTSTATKSTSPIHHTTPLEYGDGALGHLCHAVLSAMDHTGHTPSLFNYADYEVRDLGPIIPEWVMSERGCQSVSLSEGVQKQPAAGLA